MVYGHMILINLYTNTNAAQKTTVMLCVTKTKLNNKKCK